MIKFIDVCYVNNNINNKEELQFEERDEILNFVNLWTKKLNGAVMDEILADSISKNVQKFRHIRTQDTRITWVPDERLIDMLDTRTNIDYNFYYR